MQYLEIIKKAAKLTWKNKFLWIFGIFLGLSSGGGGCNFNTGGFNGNFEEMNGGDFGQFANQAGNFFAEYLWVIILIGLFLLLITFALIVLSIISQGALIGCVNKIEEEEPTNFRDGFKIGTKYFWRILGFGILITIILSAVLVAFIVPSILLFMSEVLIPLAIILIFVGIILFILLAVFISFIINYGFRFIVLKDQRIIESMKSSWELFRGNFKESILMWLILLGISIVIGIAFLIALVIVLVILGIPLVPLGFLLYSIMQWLGVAISVGIGLLIIFAVIVLYSAMFQTFMSSSWTLFFREVDKDKR